VPSDDLQKLAQNQKALQDNFLYLKKRVDAIEKRVAALDDGPVPMTSASRTVASAVSGQSAKRSKKDDDSKTKETSKPIENLGFKVFGAVGFVLILIGLFYLYRYAVDNGWIGILGRIILGVLFSLCVIVTGELFRRRGYARFSELLTGGGLALLYFTLYAAYAFREYREQLGMTATVDFTLLLIVMGVAVYLALRFDSIILTAFAFLLGYLTPVLIGLIENTGNYHTLLLTTLILSLGMALILRAKEWQLAVYPTAISYAIYMMFFFSNSVLSHSGAQAAPAVAVHALLYLLAFGALFSYLALALRDDALSTQSTLVSILVAAATLGFGLWIVFNYWHSARGVFVVALAAAYLFLAFLARQREKERLFSVNLILCVTMLTVAVPVQLERSWVTLAWAIEGFGLAQLGLRQESAALRKLAYAVLGVALARALFYDSWALGFGERTVAFAAIILALYGTAWAVSSAGKDDERFVMLLGLAATLMLTVALAVELLDPNGMLRVASQGARHVSVSVSWALEAVALIVAGFAGKSRALRLMGLVLFGIVVLKVLFVDLDNLATIYRTVVAILVGVIALGASFAYVKNKERIQELLNG
jgi:uncharacterized membrane protein